MDNYEYDQCARCRRQCWKEMYFCSLKFHAICRNCHKKDPHCSRCPGDAALTAKDEKLSRIMNIVKSHQENPDLCCNIGGTIVCTDTSQHQSTCCMKFLICPLFKMHPNLPAPYKCRFWVRHHYYKNHLSEWHSR